MGTPTTLAAEVSMAVQAFRDKLQADRAAGDVVVMDP